MEKREKKKPKNIEQRTNRDLDHKKIKEEIPNLYSITRAAKRNGFAKYQITIILHHASRFHGLC